jgi:hypothetical protein
MATGFVATFLTALAIRYRRYAALALAGVVAGPGYASWVWLPIALLGVLN